MLCTRRDVLIDFPNLLIKRQAKREHKAWLNFITNIFPWFDLTSQIFIVLLSIHLHSAIVQVVSTESDAYHLLFQGPAFEVKDAVDKIRRGFCYFLLRVTQQYPSSVENSMAFWASNPCLPYNCSFHCAIWEPCAKRSFNKSSYAQNFQWSITTWILRSLKNRVTRPPRGRAFQDIVIQSF